MLRVTTLTNVWGTAKTIVPNLNCSCVVKNEVPFGTVRKRVGKSQKSDNKQIGLPVLIYDILRRRYPKLLEVVLDRWKPLTQGLPISKHTETVT